jgi:hypothetical protein
VEGEEVTAFIAFWPDSTISVLSYPSGCEDETYEAWLFDDLDAEADPCLAEVYRLPSGFHIQTSASVEQVKETGEEKAVIYVTSFHNDGKRPRRMRWAPDALFKRWTRIRMEHRRQAASKAALDSVATYEPANSIYPPVPDPAFTIDDVREMDPFSGIYIAVNEETGAVQYVGKSKDVTRRVSASRPELKNCRIALVKMPESEIHFAELHYISKCRPTHNQEGRKSNGR